MVRENTSREQLEELVKCLLDMVSVVRMVVEQRNEADDGFRINMYDAELLKMLAGGGGVMNYEVSRRGNRTVSMIPKARLKDGHYYWGTCRNADVALWCERTGKFKYMRFKWNNRFVEEIETEEDKTEHYDYFVPFIELGTIEDFYIPSASTTNGGRYWTQ